MGSSLILPGLLSCRACPLAEGARKAVPGYGTFPSRVMIVGEAPGVEEDRTGIPFVGQAGRLLAEVFEAAGMPIDEAFRTNLVLHRPPDNRKPKPKEVSTCRHWLDEAIQLVDPSVIIAVGDTAYRVFLPGEKGKITEIHGGVFESEIQGKNRIVIPALHPAYVLRNSSARPWLEADIKRAVDIIKFGKPVVLPYSSHRLELKEVSRILRQPLFAFDLETDSLSRQAKAVGFGLCDTPGGGGYRPVYGDGDGGGIRILRRGLENFGQTKVMHNAKFEKHIMLNYGINIVNFDDTMLQSWVLGDNQSNRLKDLASTVLGQEMMRIETLIGSGKKQRSMRDVQEEDEDLVVRYSAADPDATLRLFYVQKAKLEERNQWGVYKDVEIPMVDIIVEMERNGIKFDADALEPIKVTLNSEAQRIQDELFELVGHEFNPMSAQQASQVVYDELGIASADKYGKKSTGKTAMARHAENPVVRHLLSYRAAKKLLGTYVESLPKFVEADGRIHCQINQTGAITGRVSVSEPNLQQIPARNRDDIDLGVSAGLIRRAFVSDEGWFLFCPDLSQIELRVQAHLCQDRNMIEALLGGDMHSMTAELLYGKTKEEVSAAVWKDMRFVAKTCNFGIIYGLTAEGLVLRTPQLKLTLSQASDIIRSMYRAYPELRDWQNETIRFCQKNGYTETILGRRRYVPAINASDMKLRAEAARQALNHCVQGSAADLFKLGMIGVKRRIEEFGLRTRMLLQVHDELILEVPFDEVDVVAYEVVPALSSQVELSVPVVCNLEFGFNWGDLNDWKK